MSYLQFLYKSKIIVKLNVYFKNGKRPNLLAYLINIPTSFIPLNTVMINLDSIEKHQED
jgi:hypothetical protein